MNKLFTISLLLSIPALEARHSQFFNLVDQIGQLPPSSSEDRHLQQKAYDDARHYYAQKQPQPEYDTMQRRSGSVVVKTLFGALIGGVTAAQCSDRDTAPAATILGSVAGALTGAFIGASGENRRIENYRPTYDNAKRNLDCCNAPKVEPYAQDLYRNYYWNGNLNKSVQSAIAQFTNFDDFTIATCLNSYNADQFLTTLAGQFYQDSYPFHKVERNLEGTIRHLEQLITAVTKTLNQHDQLGASKHQLLQAVLQMSHKVVMQLKGYLSTLKSYPSFIQEEQRIQQQKLFEAEQARIETERRAAQARAAAEHARQHTEYERQETERQKQQTERHKRWCDHHRNYCDYRYCTFCNR